jgi:hypothetical protein
MDYISLIVEWMKWKEISKFQICAKSKGPYDRRSRQLEIPVPVINVTIYVTTVNCKSLDKAWIKLRSSKPLPRVQG